MTKEEKIKLENEIQDLKEIEEEHRKINGELRKENEKLKNDKLKLEEKIQDVLNELNEKYDLSLSYWDSNDCKIYNYVIDMLQDVLESEE